MKETQRMKQLWVRLLVLIPLLGMALILILHTLGNTYFSFTDTEFVLMIACFLVMVLVAWMIFKIELKTLIDQKGIHVRFIPFHFKDRTYPWSGIEKVYVREYKPVSEFGGWGLRYSIKGRGRAFNVSGNQGIQIEFKDGKKLLIGTQKPEKAEAVLRKLGKWKE